MCLMVHHQKNQVFSFAEIEKMFLLNPHGLGVMYGSDDKLYHKKMIPVSPQEAYGFYLDNVAERDCAVHFRLRTHGEISFDNAHPYKITDDIFLMHNGILERHAVSGSRKSDTLHFIEDVLKPLSSLSGYLMSELFRVYLESRESNSKFILSDAKGNFNIVNANKGFEYKSAWVSNMNFMK